jgi:hypothetical protein
VKRCHSLTSRQAPAHRRLPAVNGVSCQWAFEVRARRDELSHSFPTVEGDLTVWADGAFPARVQLLTPNDGGSEIAMMRSRLGGGGTRIMAKLAESNGRQTGPPEVRTAGRTVLESRMTHHLISACQEPAGRLQPIGERKP